MRSVVKRNDPKNRQQRRFWTVDEVEDLRMGIEKYGVGNWFAMRNDPGFDFGDRNTVDLKVSL